MITLSRPRFFAFFLATSLAPTLAACLSSDAAQAPDGSTAALDAWVPESGADVPRDAADAAEDASVDAADEADATPDASLDAAIDAGADVETDVGFDAGDEAVVDVDAAVDTGADVETDVGFDAGDEPVVDVDAAIDAGADVETDVGVDVGIDAGIDAGDEPAVDVDAAIDAGLDAPADVGVDATDAAAVACAEGALAFDGDDFLDVSGTSGLHLQSAITVEAWVRTSAATAPERAIVGKHDCGTDNGWFLGAYGSNAGHADVAQFYVGANSTRALGTKSIADGEWHHLAGVWDGATASIWVDGVVEGSVTAAYTTTNSDDVTIGALVQGSCAGFLGEIDEVSLWSVARSAAQIASDRAAAPIASEPGLEGHWDFDRAACGQIAADRSTGARDATLGATTGVETSDPTWVNDGAYLAPPPLALAGWSAARGGDVAAPSGGLFANTRSIMERDFTVTWSAYDDLAALATSGADGVVVSSIANCCSPVAAVSATEQTALHDWIAGGRFALLLLDNSNTFLVANVGLAGAVGLTNLDGLSGPATATVIAAHPVTAGITTLPLMWPGAVADPGPPALVLATSPAGPLLVAFDHGALGAGSGRVVVIADSSPFYLGSGVEGPAARMLISNALHWCAGR